MQVVVYFFGTHRLAFVHPNKGMLIYVVRPDCVGKFPTFMHDVDRLTGLNQLAHNKRLAQHG